MKSAFALPVMNNVGRNTATTQSIASKRGRVVSAVALNAARDGETPRCRCEWMFSSATVDSSTRMPTASARPLRDMRFTV